MSKFIATLFHTQFHVAVDRRASEPSFLKTQRKQSQGKRDTRESTKKARNVALGLSTVLDPIRRRVLPRAYVRAGEKEKRERGRAKE